jgi:hypothetical protein
MDLGWLWVALRNSLASSEGRERRHIFNVNVAPELMGGGELSAGSRIWVVEGCGFNFRWAAPDNV